MAQAVLAPLNPATTSGTTLATKLVNAEEANLTQHSGTSRPSYVEPGTLWLDTTTDPWIWKLYDGTSDIGVFAFDVSTHRRHSPAPPTTIASGATTDVLGNTADFVGVSGTATISSLGNEPSQIKFVIAFGAFTLVHSASLSVPTGANITAAAGDTFIVVSTNTGEARVFAYTRATGLPLVVPTSDIPSTTAMLFFQTAAPTGWTKDTVNYNDHAIRIVTGSVASGGSLNFSTVFGKFATDSHTLTAAQMPTHSHGPGSLAGFTNNPGNHTHGYIRYGARANRASGGSGSYWDADQVDDTDPAGGHTHSVAINTGVTDNAGSGGSHSHNMDIRVRYIDAIRAAKN